MKPKADHLSRARAIRKRLSDEQVLALVGNWRPLKAPPLPEFVRHCLIVEKRSGQLIPFELWPAQEEALEVIEHTDKLVVPKGRQVGITWLELAAMLWAGTFFGHRLFPIARQSDEYAREAITRLLILAGYDPTSEPGKLRLLAESPLPQQWRPRIAGKTRRELRLTNGSSYRALTATQPIARGLAAYWGLADEYRLLALAGPPAGGHGVGLCSVAHRLVPATAPTTPSRPSMRTPPPDGRLPHAVHRLRCRPETRWGLVSRNVEEAADPESARREHARCVADAFRSPEGAYFKRFRAERHVTAVDDRRELADLAGDRLRLPPSRLSVGAALTGRAALRRR